MTCPRLITIFDLDGTLVDSDVQVHDAANAVLAEEGLAPIAMDRLRPLLGFGLKALVGSLIQVNGGFSSPRQCDRMVAQFRTFYETRLDGIQLFGHVEAALEDLSHHSALALCTNRPVSVAYAILDHFNLRHLFPVVVGGDSLNVCKPDPAPVRLACKNLDTQTAVFVGDSAVDAEAAFRSGLPFLRFDNTGRFSDRICFPVSGQFSSYRQLSLTVQNFNNSSFADVPVAAAIH